MLSILHCQSRVEEDSWVTYTDRGRQCGQRGPVPSHLHLTMVTIF